jgi:ABC-type maltose transport system permease subunit
VIEVFATAVAQGETVTIWFTGDEQQGAALLVSLPTLALFIAFQWQFVQGIALTGMKG